MTRKPFKVHPLIARLLPPASEEEIDRAVERVRLYGQREPIETVEGQIVACHLEYLGCVRARVTPKITKVTAPDDLVEYVVRRNVPRYLSTLDRACIAVLAQEEFKRAGIERMREAGRIGGTLKGAKGRVESARPFDGERWFEAAAKVVHTTAGAVKQLATLYKNQRDIFDAVRARRIPTLREARHLAWQVKEPRSRAKLLERYEISKKATPILKLIHESNRESRAALMPDGHPKGKRYVVYTGPMDREAKRIASDSIDLVHADVVYRDVPMVEEVARISARVLVNGGVLALIAGNERVVEVIGAVTSQGLTLITIGSMILPGSTSSLAGGAVKSLDSVPVYIFTKGEKPTRPIDRLAYFGEQREKQFHKWQKPLSATTALVEAMIDPGGVVLDPCCGSGTTGVAAMNHGCTFIGVEVVPETARVAASRLTTTERGSLSKVTNIRRASKVA